MRLLLLSLLIQGCGIVFYADCSFEDDYALEYKPTHELNIFRHGKAVRQVKAPFFKHVALGKNIDGQTYEAQMFLNDEIYFGRCFVIYTNEVH